MNITLNDVSQKNIYTSAGGSSATSDLRNIISNESHIRQYTNIQDKGKSNIMNSIFHVIITCNQSILTAT